MSLEDRTALYAAAGEALHMGQVLELNLSVLIELLNRGYDADIDTRKIIIDGDKRTLGQLIAVLKKRATLSPETEDALATALGARNYVAHEVFLRITDAFGSAEAYSAAVQLVKAKSREVIIGTAITQSFVEGFTKQLGKELSDVLIRQDI